MSDRPRSPLTHPLPWAAAALLAVNDHVLKGAGVLPAWLTGKLSDFAGLFVAPLVVAALARAALRGRARASIDAAACAAVAVGFALVKCWAPVNVVWGALLGPTLRDPSDLVALPAALGAWAWLRREPSARAAASRAGAPARLWLDRAGLVLAALASMATSAVHPPQMPVPGPQRDFGQDCANVTLLGVEPRGPDVAVVLHLENTQPAPCVIGFARVELEGASSGGLAAGAAAAPREERLGPGASRDVTYMLAPPYPVACPTNAKLHLETTQTADPPAAPWTGHRTTTPPQGVEAQCLPPAALPVVAP